MPETVDQTDIRKYLLGDLPEADSEAFEERFFSDDGAFLELQAAEMVLIDAYVRREMSQDDRDRFEANYLVSPERHAKLAAAMAFHDELSDMRPAVEPATEKAGWFSRLAGLFMISSPAMQFAGAALTILLAISTTWLLLDRSRTRNDLQAARNTETELNRQLNERQQDLDRRVAGQRGEDSESLAALQKEIDDLQKQLDDSKIKQVNQNTTSQRPLVATFILSASRGAGSAVPTINLPDGTKVLNIKLPLDGETAPFYVDISIGGKTVFSKKFEQLPKGGSPAANLSLPASGIVDGQYVLTIRESSGDMKTRSFIVARNKQ